MHDLNQNFDNGGVFDPLKGYAEMLNRSNATNKGRREGMQEGYNQGFEEGKSVGWDEGIAAGNVEMRKALGYIRLHVADKEQLHSQVKTLEQQLLVLREESFRLRASDATRCQLVDALKSANARLHEQVSALDSAVKHRNNAYVEQVWQNNRCMVFANAVRGVLEDLTSGTPSQGEKVRDYVRDLFVKKYTQEVRLGLEQGAIKAAPQTDESFIKNMPKTQKFIIDMLSLSDK